MGDLKIYTCLIYAAMEIKRTQKWVQTSLQRAFMASCLDKPANHEV